MNSCPSLVLSSWELIDTLWNVNLIAASMFGVTTPELIDTLWNVNDGKYILINHSKSN